MPDRAEEPDKPNKRDDAAGAAGQESEAERRRRRAAFLRDLDEGRELRKRVQPRRAKAERMRHAMLMRTFRW